MSKGGEVNRPLNLESKCLAVHTQNERAIFFSFPSLTGLFLLFCCYYRLPSCRCLQFSSLPVYPFDHIIGTISEHGGSPLPGNGSATAAGRQQKDNQRSKCVFCYTGTVGLLLFMVLNHHRYCLVLCYLLGVAASSSSSSFSSSSSSWSCLIAPRDSQQS